MSDSDLASALIHEISNKETQMTRENIDPFAVPTAIPPTANSNANVTKPPPLPGAVIEKLNKDSLVSTGNAAAKGPPPLPPHISDRIGSLPPISNAASEPLPSMHPTMSMGTVFRTDSSLAEVDVSRSEVRLATEDEEGGDANFASGVAAGGARVSTGVRDGTEEEKLNSSNQAGGGREAEGNAPRVSADEIVGSMVGMVQTQSRTGSIEDTLRNEPAGDSWEWYTWRLATFMEEPTTRWSIVGLVFLNGILIGLEADGRTDGVGWEVVGYSFIVIFGLEIAFKLVAFRWSFFTEAWNVFDFFIVLTSVIELIAEATSDSKSAGLSVFRLMRVFRVLRLVVYVERLNILVQAFLLALKSVVWVGVLLMMVLYMFAVIAQGLFGQDEDLINKVEGIEEWFGTIPRAMATLIQIMTYDNWTAIARPIGDEYPIAWLFFILWIAIAAVGLLNLLTAVFIDALTDLSKQAEVNKKVEQQEKKMEVIKWICQLFHTFDEDESGELDEEEIAAMFALFDDKKFKVLMEEAGVAVNNIKEAIRFSDKDGSGTVDYQEFLDAISTMDEASVKRDSWELTARIRTLEAVSSDQADELEIAMDKVADRIGADVKTLGDDLKAMCTSTEAQMDSIIQRLEREVGQNPDESHWSSLSS